MAEKDIIQNMISRLGQSQDDRLPPELDPHFVDVDERTNADLLAQARTLSQNLRFYRHTPDFSSGNWSTFFPDGDDTALLAREDGQVPPHLGLFAAFLHLYRYPQQEINTLTGRHLDFQFRDVLRFAPKPAQPDHAHLLLELKKGVSPVAILPDLMFTAGKDGSGAELVYRPVRENVIGHGKVESLQSVFHNSEGIFFAPVANSQDGSGGALAAAQPKWRAFGGSDLPPAHIGFALSSPVLHMQEGSRTVRLDLWLSGMNSNLTADKLSNALEAYLTGSKGWLGPLGGVKNELSADKLSLQFAVETSAPAVVNYDTGIHGHAFAAQAPVLQLLLKPGASLHYDDLKNLVVTSAQLTVTVDGLQNLSLENDDGSLNPKKAFLPFGSQPVKGSQFMIGCEEALSKQLADLKVKFSWLDAPGNLTTWYANYSNVGQMSDGISANLIYQDRSGPTPPVEQTLMARVCAGVSTIGPKVPKQTSPGRPADSKLFALLSSGSIIGRLLGNKFKRERPIYQRDTVPQPTPRSGYITVALIDDFLHSDYLRETVYNTVNQVKDTQGKVIVLNKPYTPKVQTISLYYQAQSDKVEIDTDNEDDFTNLDLQFFHVGCFGQRREHAYLRRQYSYVGDKHASLLPDYGGEGEFLIGVSGVGAGDSLSLLMQVAEDSANPDLEPQRIEWSVLADNYWRTLTPQELVLDTSNNLRASGIVSATLPQETSTENSWMPGGRVWLRAHIEKNSAATCQLLGVAANAVEVRFADRGNDPAHLSSPLAPGRIAKLKTPQAGVKTVSQPYAGFGGHPEETEGMLTRRAAERLRHRNRCITPWDYERMLLEAFPNVHKVKCIPHAGENSWLAPGQVMVVVVPDLHNQNTADQLQPRVDIDTLVRMQDYAQQHAGRQVRIKVRNPRYQSVLVDFKVRFHPGYPYNYYRMELQQALLRALTPWAYDKTRDIEFGGRIYRSVLLDFVEELPYVDFVTDFKMGLVNPNGALLQDVSEISADTPDTILVSNATHNIAEYPDA